MNVKTILSSTVAGLALATFTAAPVLASAQTSQESSHRQQKKNEWRNLAIGSGALGLFGLLKGDNTLMFAGAAGSLYSAYRYEQDRKSQSKTDRARAAMFSRTSFIRDGHKYVRHTSYKNGKKYYYFARVN